MFKIKKINENALFVIKRDENSLKKYNLFNLRQLLTVFFLCISTQLFSQKELFDTIKVDSTTKIIGRYPQYDKTKTYENYNFIIEDSAKIVKFINSLKLGKKVPNLLENPSFRLAIVKNKKEIGCWSVNFRNKSVLTHDGNTFEFDLNQIKNLNEIYPFSYSFEIKIFNTKNEYDQYLPIQKTNSAFLFDYKPYFKYEGSFEIEFPKTSKFSNPRAIMNFLAPYIEKIVKKDEYSFVYILNDKNRSNNKQYTITISSSKTLFDKLYIRNLENENWKTEIENGYFFYKK